MKEPMPPDRDATGTPPAPPPQPGSVASADRRWIGAAAVAWVLSGLFYLTLPPSADQFELSYLGWRIVEGDVLYRDLIDMNWPGTLWLHALSSFLFGNRLGSSRAMDFLVMAMGAGFLADYLRRSAGAAAARFCLVLMPLLYASLSEWVAGQNDMSAAHFFPGVLWCHLRAQEPRGWRFQIGAGAFLGAAMLGKPSAGALGALLAAQSILLKVPPRRVVGHTAVAAASCVAVLAAAFGVLRASGASTRDIIDCIWTYNAETQFASATPFSLMLTSLASRGGWFWFLSLAGLPGVLWAFGRGRRSIATTAPAAVWITGLVSYWFQRKGHGYHLAMAFPALMAFLSMGLAATWENPVRRRHCLVGLLLVLAFVGWRWGRNYNSSFQARHYDRYYEADGLTLTEALALAARMERDLSEQETALVFGAASSMNYLSRRPQPSRFYYSAVLHHAVPPLSMADRWCDLWEQDLRRSVPRLCLIPTDIEDWLAGDHRAARILRTFLAAGYRREGVVGRNPGMTLYVREAP